ncbi:TIGR04013 family B12-binding domain/radical SAM domain-containing protein [Thermotoga profunda]|uniref:TIGR04013 family B12-binding domain/radical SAM domain-containing protein n=1 Tax=Thermotoga profunda TaxID=1508420 RepID=UPI0005972D43|nr:TIGR04013 family B12-binding domain/radical SAM domain-containing protein [Thermotoga profunda]
MKLIFRMQKNNRYSLIPLISAVHSRVKDVQIFLANDVREILKIEPPAVVAYSFMSFDLDQISKEIQKLKVLGYTLIAGGPHVTARPFKSLELGFHHIFIGDGEENLIRFLNGEQDVIFDGLKNRINLDDYPPFCVDLDLFMPLEITRGCVFDCAYCETSLIGGRKPRHRSIESIIHYCELGLKKNKYIARFISPNSFGYGSIDGIKPNVNAIDTMLFELKKIGMREIYFGTFPSDVRPESVSDDLLKAIKKYVNNRSITIGAQSGSERVLKKIKRTHSVENLLKAIDLILSNDFTPYVDFIFGFPFETDEDRYETLNLIDKLVRIGCKIHAHTFMPLPGTELEQIGSAVIPEWFRKRIAQLSSQGKLDGYWEKQRILSQKLAGR